MEEQAQITMEEMLKDLPEKQPNYQWAPDAEIKISGKAFELMFNMLQAKVNTPEAQEIIISIHLLEELQNVFTKGIEQGIIKDMNAE